jgi:GT2 family glycosyltransferase
VVDPRANGAPELVSVVICAYAMERFERLLAAIDSVLGQAPELGQAPPSGTTARGTPPPQHVDVVVVVDHNPELLEAVARARPGVVAVANAGPRGLSGARNTGIDHARGGLVGFLDDDAVADDGWLAGLRAAFADPAVVVAGGRIDADWETGRPSWFPEEFDWVVGCSYRGQLGGGDGGAGEAGGSAVGAPAARAPAAPVPVRNVIGASMMVRRSAFDAVGGFRTDLGRVGTVPVGGEETELCIRVGARFGRGAVVHVADARVRHHVTAARATVAYVHRRCYAEGLSKAVLARLAGPRDGLSSEARYLTRTLPRAFVRHLLAGLRGDAGGVRRAAVLFSGTWLTAVGWLTGTLSARRLHPS